MTRSIHELLLVTWSLCLIKVKNLHYFHLRIMLYPEWRFQLHNVLEISSQFLSITKTPCLLLKSIFGKLWILQWGKSFNFDFIYNLYVFVLYQWTNFLPWFSNFSLVNNGTINFSCFFSKKIKNWTLVKGIPYFPSIIKFLPSSVTTDP